MTRMSVKINGKLDNFNINFEHDFFSNGITVLYGPNGSGKSTIISCIGGFIDGLDIKVKLNDIMLDGGTKVPPHKRPLGIMFQNPILFEHLTVNQNLIFAIIIYLGACYILYTMKHPKMFDENGDSKSPNAIIKSWRTRRLPKLTCPLIISPVLGSATLEP